MLYIFSCYFFLHKFKKKKIAPPFDPKQKKVVKANAFLNYTIRFSQGLKGLEDAEEKNDDDDDDEDEDEDEEDDENADEDK